VDSVEALEGAARGVPMQTAESTGAGVDQEAKTTNTQLKDPVGTNRADMKNCDCAESEQFSANLHILYVHFGLSNDPILFKDGCGRLWKCKDFAMLENQFLSTYAVPTVQALEFLNSKMELGTETKDKRAPIAKIVRNNVGTNGGTNVLGRVSFQLARSLHFRRPEVFVPRFYLQILSNCLRDLFAFVETRVIMHIHKQVSTVLFQDQLCILKTHKAREQEYHFDLGCLAEMMLALFLHFYPHPCLPTIHFIRILPLRTEVCTNYTPIPFTEVFRKHHELSVSYIKRCCFELGSAISHLHASNLSHRDIKAENIQFTSEGRLVLIDFDLSCARVTSYSPRYGSFSTMAPELFENRGAAGVSCLSVDVFCAGCVFFAMFNEGVFPSAHYSDWRTTYGFSDPPPRFASRIGDFFPMLQSMMHVAPSKRPSIRNVLDHPFFGDMPANFRSWHDLKI
jgi:serine/threonine protein kinase